MRMMGRMGVMVGVVVVLMGCATASSRFSAVAGKFLSSTALTVDAAMQGWASWVVAGKATPADEASVRAVYGNYQVAMGLATNAYALVVITGDTSLFVEPSNRLVGAKMSVVSSTLKGK